MEIKKALFLKIFYEYVQASEHLLAVVHAVKQGTSIKGIKERIVDSPSGGTAFKYLWTDLRKFRSDPFKLYRYLGLRVTREQYLADKKALDGFLLALISCLKNRYKHTRGGKVSRVMKAFGKIKHGFPVFTARGSDTIHFLVKNRGRISRIPFKFDATLAEEIVESTDAIRTSMLNLSAILLYLK